MARLPTDTDTDTHDEGLGLGPRPEDVSRASWRAFLVGLGIIVVVVGSIMAVIRFVVLPQQDAAGEAQFVRAQATLSVLQTREALTPKPTAVPTLAPGVIPTSAPATKGTPASTGAPGTAPGTVPLATAPSQSQVTVTSAPAVATSSAPRATAASTSSPTATSVPAGVTTGQPASTTTPAAAVPSGAAPTGGSSADQERIPLAVQGGIDPALVAELEHAYWLYWQRLATALLTLDVSPVREVGDDVEVNGTAKYIEELRAKGHAVVTDVRHNAQLLSATDVLAVIADAEEDHSYYVNLATGQPEEPRPPVQVLKTERRFEKLDGAWKVTGSQPYE